MIYFPLCVRSRIQHENYGWIPNKNTQKCKRLCKEVSGNKLYSLLSSIYFNLNKETVTYLHSLLSLTPDILKMLYSVIPLEYFGSRGNRKLFFFVVKRILTQSKEECIHLSVLYEGYDYDAISWLNKKQTSQDQLKHANILVLQTVVKPLIKYFYYFLNNFKSRQFFVIPRGQIYSFNDKNLANSLKIGYLSKVRPENLKATQVRGALRYIPKSNIKCLTNRPIVLNYLKNKSALKTLKTNLNSLINKYEIGPQKDLYRKWKIFSDNTKAKKLYAIKLDLLDAFGNIDLDILCSIIKNDEEYLTDWHKQYLLKIVKEPYVHVQGKTQIYRWNHGLIQGTRLSPGLCELYMGYLDYKYLSNFAKPYCFIHRTVDDIFFASTCQNEIFEFELAVAQVHLLNEKKTIKFLNNPDENPCMVYCGKVFNLATRELACAYSFERQTEIRTKFKFWNPKYPFSKEDAIGFITNSMNFSYVNYYFSRFELNTTCNSVETVLKNIFDGMCFTAFKMDCAIESIKYLFSDTAKYKDTVLKCIDYVVEKYYPMILGVIKKYKGEKYKRIFDFCTIKFIILKAFTVVFQRRNFTYKLVLKELKERSRKFYVSSRDCEINVKYFYKLPEPFRNIRMHRMISIKK